MRAQSYNVLRLNDKGRENLRERNEFIAEVAENAFLLQNKSHAKENRNLARQPWYSG
jgi:hypothetical protein